MTALTPIAIALAIPMAVSVTIDTIATQIALVTQAQAWATVAPTALPIASAIQPAANYRPGQQCPSLACS